MGFMMFLYFIFFIIFFILILSTRSRLTDLEDKFRRLKVDLEMNKISLKKDKHTETADIPHVDVKTPDVNYAHMKKDNKLTQTIEPLDSETIETFNEEIDDLIQNVPEPEIVQSPTLRHSSGHETKDQSPITKLSSEAIPPHTDQPQAKAKEEEPEPIIESPRPKPLDLTPTKPNPIFEYIKNFFTTGNVVVKIGVLILLIGFSFLFKYAAEQGYFPIEVRLICGAIFAIGLTALGFFLRKKKEVFGLVLQGGGIGLFYMVVFVAFEVYKLIPCGLTFVILVLTVIASSLLAVLQNAKTLAIIALAGGFLAPVLVPATQDNHVALFSYYAILNIGVLAIAWFRAWRFLNVMGFTFTFVLSAAWGLSQDVTNFYATYFSTTEPFLILFFLFYIAIVVLYSIRKSTDVSSLIDGGLVFGTPLVVFSLQYKLVSTTEYGMAITAAALGFFYLSLAWSLFKYQSKNLRSLIESFIAIGVVFTTLMIPLAFNAQVTSAFWALKGAGLIWIGLRQKHTLARFFGSVLIIASGFALFHTFDSHYSPDLTRMMVFNGTYLGCLIKAIAALAGAYFLNKHKDGLNDFDKGMSFFFVVFGLFWWFFGAGWELKELAPKLLVNEFSFIFILASLVAGYFWVKRFIPNRIVLFHNTAILFSAITAFVFMQQEAFWLSTTWVVVGFLGSFYGIKKQVLSTRYLSLFLMFLSGFALFTLFNVNPTTQDKTVFVFNQVYLGSLLKSVFILLTAYLLNKNKDKLTSLDKKVCIGFVIYGLFWWFLAGLKEVYDIEQSRWVNLISFGFLFISINLSFILAKKYENNIRPIIYNTTLISSAVFASAIMTPYWVSTAFVLTGATYAIFGLKKDIVITRFLGYFLSFLATFVVFPQIIDFILNNVISGKESTIAIFNISFTTGFLRVLLGFYIGWHIFKFEKDNLYKNSIALLFLFFSLLQWFYIGIKELYLFGPETPFLALSVIFIVLNLSLLESLHKTITWSQLRLPGYFFLPFMIILVVFHYIPHVAHPFKNMGWLAWPLIGVYHFWFLKRIESKPTPSKALSNHYHVLGFWLLVVIISWEAAHAMEVYLADTFSWITGARVVIPTLIMFGICAFYNKILWPVNKFKNLYIEIAMIPIVLFGLGWTVVVNSKSNGNAAPLPYIPLLNPIDLTMILIFVVSIFWLITLHKEKIATFMQSLINRRRLLYVGFFLLVFYWINALLIRSIHQYLDVPFHLKDLYHSIWVQMSLSIYWCFIASCLMIYATRKAWRGPWITGAILLGVVVLKFIFVDFANRATMQQIVSTIVVGILFLIIGYFSPIPPQKKEEA